jgi:SAM-dependent methyltransferase
MSELPDHVARNRRFWNDYAPQWIEAGHDDWAAEEPRWGIWRVPESEVGLLPAELEGKDTIELGCGTGYVSAWLARRGARPVGIDNSEAQLETARRFQQEFGIEFPLLHGNAEEVPLPDAGFDVAISEYGASIWADPYRWIPEASRLLALLRESGFEIEELIEIQPPEGSTTRLPGSDLEWSRRWPLEEAWRARKR